MNTKKAIVIIICCLSVVILSACVPTPDKEYVTQKDITHMLDLAKATAEITEDHVQESEQTSAPKVTLRERCQAPERVEKQFTWNDGRFHLDIDATVFVPDCTESPIFRVEQANFTQDVVKALFESLCSGVEMYDEQSVMTKQQITLEIAQIAESMSDPSFETENNAEYVQNVQNRLAYLKSIYGDAPDNAEMNLCDGALREMHHYSEVHHVPLDTYWGVEARGRDSQGNLQYFSTENRNDVIESQIIDGNRSYKRDARVHYENMRRTTMREKLKYIPFPDRDERPFTYSPAQAEQDVKDLLSQTNLSEYRIESLYMLQGKSEENQSSEAYLIHCVREIMSVPVTYLRIGTISRRDALSPSWGYESFDVCIDKDGVFYLSWSSPYRIADTVLKDCKLLPFDSVFETFIKQMEITFTATMGDPDMVAKGYGATLERSFLIDRITFGLQRINEPGVFDTALLVPSWSFYGTVKEVYVESGSSNEITEEKRYDNAVICINAIDGSIIDLTKGY